MKAQLQMIMIMCAGQSERAGNDGRVYLQQADYLKCVILAAVSVVEMVEAAPTGGSCVAVR